MSVYLYVALLSQILISQMYFDLCCVETESHFHFPVLMGDDKTVVTRGCTALDNEDLYKCDMHTAGNQVKRCDLCVFTFPPYYMHTAGNHVKWSIFGIFFTFPHIRAQVFTFFIMLQIFTFCNCHGSGCNKDWDSAGETSSLEVRSLVVRVSNSWLGNLIYF